MTQFPLSNASLKLAKCHDERQMSNLSKRHKKKRQKSGSSNSGAPQTVNATTTTTTTTTSSGAGCSGQIIVNGQAQRSASRACWMLVASCTLCYLLLVCFSVRGVTARSAERADLAAEATRQRLLAASEQLTRRHVTSDDADDNSAMIDESSDALHYNPQPLKATTVTASLNRNTAASLGRELDADDANLDSAAFESGADQLRSVATPNDAQNNNNNNNNNYPDDSSAGNLQPNLATDNSDESGLTADGDLLRTRSNLDDSQMRLQSASDFDESRKLFADNPQQQQQHQLHLQHQEQQQQQQQQQQQAGEASAASIQRRLQQQPQLSDSSLDSQAQIPHAAQQQLQSIQELSPITIGLDALPGSGGLFSLSPFAQISPASALAAASPKHQLAASSDSGEQNNGMSPMMPFGFNPLPQLLGFQSAFDGPQRGDQSAHSNHHHTMSAESENLANNNNALSHNNNIVNVPIAAMASQKVWPKIFRFTDGRANLSDFEREKKIRLNKNHNIDNQIVSDPIIFDNRPLRRKSFLILHGGVFARR